MAKVVTFGAFVEILPGVEGLVHISELAPHHVENPREVVSQGDAVNVRILEIDGERRRLSLSLKRVEEGDQPVPRADGAESVHTMPDLKLSEEAFPTTQRRRRTQEATRSEAEVDAARARRPRRPARPSRGRARGGARVAERPSPRSSASGRRRREPAEDSSVEVGSERSDSD